MLVSHSFSLTSEDGREHEPLVLLTGRWSVGSVCVAIFFIISGFLIAQSADRNRSILRFAEKRILRIFPALIVNVFMVTLILGPLISTLYVAQYFTSAATIGYLKLAFLLPHLGQLPGVFSNNPFRGIVNGSLWTLRSEMACYALTAGLVYILKARKTLPYLVLALSVLLISAFIRIPASAHIDLFGLFLTGSLFYWSRHYIPLSGLGAFAASLVFMLSLRWSALSPLGIIGLSYATIATGYLGEGFGWLHHRDYSYGLYLWAFPVQQTLIHFHRMAWWVNVLTAFPVALGLAMLSWHFVEKPMKAIKYSLAE